MTSSFGFQICKHQRESRSILRTEFGLARDFESEIEIKPKRASLTIQKSQVDGLVKVKSQRYFKYLFSGTIEDLSSTSSAVVCYQAQLWSCDALELLRKM